MKIRFLKPTLVVIVKTRLDECWDHFFTRWDEIKAEKINYSGKKAEICTEEGDILHDVPIESFEVIQK